MTVLTSRLDTAAPDFLANASRMRQRLAEAPALPVRADQADKPDKADQAGATAAPLPARTSP